MKKNNNSEKLSQVLNKYRRLAIAFSGGTDSTLLLKAASVCLQPENIIAFTARAPIFSQQEERQAQDLAASFGVKHIFLDFAPLELEAFASNMPDRCYICKKAIFQQLIEAAQSRNFDYVADGANLDDDHDYRPGSMAIKELGVVSPLKEACLTKSEVRLLSRDWGLPTWDKPAAACLASRMAYGYEINAERLAKIEKAEVFLRKCGFKSLRVRLHEGEMARIEVGHDERSKFFSEKLLDDVYNKLKTLGFNYITFDLYGYRTGSHNEIIDMTTALKVRT